jgi:hypothetical protein
VGIKTGFFYFAQEKSISLLTQGILLVRKKLLSLWSSYEIACAIKLRDNFFIPGDMFMHIEV